MGFRVSACLHARVPSWRAPRSRTVDYPASAHLLSMDGSRGSALCGRRGSSGARRQRSADPGRTAPSVPSTESKTPARSPAQVPTLVRHEHAGAQSRGGVPALRARDLGRDDLRHAVDVPRAAEEGSARADQELARVAVRDGGEDRPPGGEVLVRLPGHDARPRARRQVVHGQEEEIRGSHSSRSRGAGGSRARARMATAGRLAVASPRRRRGGARPRPQASGPRGESLERLKQEDVRARARDEPLTSPPSTRRASLAAGGRRRCVWRKPAWTIRNASSSRTGAGPAKSSGSKPFVTVKTGLRASSRERRTSCRDASSVFMTIASAPASTDRIRRTRAAGGAPSGRPASRRAPTGRAGRRPTARRGAARAAPPPRPTRTATSRRRPGQHAPALARRRSRPRPTSARTASGTPQPALGRGRAAGAGRRLAPGTRSTSSRAGSSAASDSSSGVQRARARCRPGHDDRLVAEAGSRSDELRRDRCTPAPPTGGK